MVVTVKTGEPGLAGLFCQGGGDTVDPSDENKQIGISLTLSCKYHNTPLLELHAKIDKRGVF